MNADECRKRAAQCQQEADRAWGTLRLNFLAAAETWLDLAEQMDRLAKAPAAKVKLGKADTDESS